MIKICKCEVCGKEYKFRASINRLNSRFCSNACKNTVVGTWVKGNRFKWSQLTEQEKWGRLRKSFDKNAIKKEGCWGWKGNVASSIGYGRVQFFSKYKAKPAHVVSWLLHRGEIPKGMCVLHKCDQPSCTNPDHLFLGTQYENVRDMVYKGRQARGSKSPRAKLNEEQVKDIKNMIADGKTDLDIAVKYKVTPQAIYMIRIGRNWKHIEV